jgi:hypothetical protein
MQIPVDGYLSINISNEDLLEKIKTSIKNRIPLSLTRFGDGEIRHLKDCVPDSWIEYYNTSWGINSREEGLSLIYKIIKDGIEKSDVIGIMDKKSHVCEIIGYDYETWGIPSNFLEDKDKIICDHQISRSPELGDVTGFKKIINGTSLCLISPRKNLLEGMGLEKKLDASISFLEVPEGINLKERDKIINSFDKIKEDVVVFGCSVRGKDFGVHLKQRGKIALDLGATLDAWSGLVTRKWFERGNIQSHCLIIKNE